MAGGVGTRSFSGEAENMRENDWRMEWRVMGDAPKAVAMVQVRRR